jgi:hypothetical protein
VDHGIKAEVRFEQGREHYSKVTIDGKPIEPNSLSTPAMAFISQGEFGSDLVNLFKPPIVPNSSSARTEDLAKFRH